MAKRHWILQSIVHIGDVWRLVVSQDMTPHNYCFYCFETRLRCLQAALPKQSYLYGRFGHFDHLWICSFLFDNFLVPRVNLSWNFEEHVHPEKLTGRWHRWHPSTSNRQWKKKSTDIDLVTRHRLSNSQVEISTRPDPQHYLSCWKRVARRGLKASNTVAWWRNSSQRTNWYFVWQSH